MKKTIISIIFCLLWLPVFSQASFPTPDQIETFKKSKTLVVLENNVFSLYNSFIKKAVQKEWKLTPYEFISYDEFRQKKKNPSYSFLVLTSTAFERDKAGVYYDFLNLLLGDPVNNLSRLPEFCSFPLTYAEADGTAYQSGLPAILLFMQKHVRDIMKHPRTLGLRYLQYYNKNIHNLKNKVLWLVSGDLSPEINTKEKIKALYAGAFKIVSEEELDKALEKPAGDMVFLMKVGPEGTSKKGRVYKMILGTDGTLYYFRYHLLSAKKPDGILASDLKRLGRF